LITDCQKALLSENKLLQYQKKDRLDYLNRKSIFADGNTETQRRIKRRESNYSNELILRCCYNTSVERIAGIINLIAIELSHSEQLIQILASIQEKIAEISELPCDFSEK
jgi:hypothetical protein